jgi:hypothetical protein
MEQDLISESTLSLRLCLTVVTYQVPSIAVIFEFGDILKHYLIPVLATRRILRNRNREDEEFGRAYITGARGGSTIQFYQHDEVAIELAADKSTCIGWPSTLDRDVRDAATRRARGDDVVTRHVCVCLVCGNSLDKELSEN